MTGQKPPLLILLLLRYHVTCDTNDIWKTAAITKCQKTLMCAGQSWQSPYCKTHADSFHWRYKTVSTASHWSPCGPYTTRVQDIRPPDTSSTRQIHKTVNVRQSLAAVVLKIFIHHANMVEQSIVQIKIQTQIKSKQKTVTERTENTWSSTQIWTHVWPIMHLVKRNQSTLDNTLQFQYF